MSSSESRLVSWRTTSYAVWAAIGILLLMAAAGYALGRLSAALAPFVLAFIVVFLTQGAVTWMEGRGLKRTWAVVAVFVIGLGTLGLVLTLLVPVVARQLADFAAEVPGYLTQFGAFIEKLQQQYNRVVIPDWVRDTATSIVESLSKVLVSVGNGVAQGIVGAGSSIATVIFDLFMGFVIAFWVLRDLPKIREELVTLAGEKYEADVENLVFTVVRVVGGYLKGQTLASLVTGALAGIGLAILGVPYALVLALITFVLNYIPYVGPFVSGLIAAVVAALMVSPLAGLLSIVVVVAAQQVTDLFFTPRVMSEQVDLHPTLVIFSLLVGGTLFGFWGMIFSIPVAATVKGLFVYYWEQRTQRTLATEDGALFRAPSGDDDDSDAEKSPNDAEGSASDTHTEKGSD